MTCAVCVPCIECGRLGWVGEDETWLSDGMRVMYCGCREEQEEFVDYRAEYEADRAADWWGEDLHGPRGNRR